MYQAGTLMAKDMADEEVLDQDDDLDLEENEGLETQEAADEQSGGDGAEADAPAFSPRAMELAAQTGLDPADYRDEAAFLRGVAAYDRSLNAYVREQQGRFQPKADDHSGQEAKAQAAQKAALKRWEMKLKSDGVGAIDDDIINSFKSLDEHYHPQLEALMGQIEELKAANKEYGEFRKSVEEQRQYEAQERLIQKWDRFFDSVGDEYHAKLGKGSLQQLANAHSTHFLSARNEIVDFGEQLRQRDLAAGRRPLSDEEYGKRAVHAILGQETIATARKQILTQVKGRNGAALAGTNTKKANKKPLVGEGKAWETFRAKAKEVGLQLGPDDEEE